MNSFLLFVKNYSSEIIGIVQIFVAFYLDHKNRRKK